MNLLFLLFSLASCASPLPAAKAPPCPERPAIPYDTVCPAGTEPTQVGLTRGCLDEHGNLHGPWVVEQQGEIVSWGWNEHGRARGRALRGDPGPSWTLQEHPGDFAHRPLLQCVDGTLRVRVTETREQRWDEQGAPLLDVQLEDGVELRRRVWRDGVLRADVSRDGAGRRWSADGAVVWEASMTAGHPTGEIVSRWPDGSERLRLIRRVVEPEALEPAPSLAPWSHAEVDGRHRGGWEARQLCDARDEDLPTWMRWVPPPGLACEGAVVAWAEDGSVVVEGTYVDGYREGTFQTHGPGQPVQVERFSRGRRVLGFRRGSPGTAVITHWRDEVPVAREHVDRAGLFPPRTAEERTETHDELVATGRVLVDARGGAHRDGTWEVSTEDGLPVRTEHWVEGRLGDVVLHARRVQIRQASAGRVGRSYQEVLNPRYAWTAMDDTLRPASVERLPGLPLPDTPVRWETVARVADAVDRADPEADDLIRWCWDALPDPQREGRRLPEGRGAPVAALDAEGLEPAAVVDVLRRRSAAPEPGRPVPVARRACLGDAPAMLRGGPTWEALAVERIARDRPNADLAPRAQWVRGIVTDHGWTTEPSPDWDAEVGPGLRDPRWDPWIRGWREELVAPGRPAPAHVGTLPLGDATLVFVTRPCPLGACTVMALDHVEGSPGLPHLLRPRIEAVWTPPGPILDATTDGEVLTLTWRDGTRRVSRELLVQRGRPPADCPSLARRPGGSFGHHVVTKAGRPLCGE